MSKEQEAYDYFVAKGWTPAQAAGIVGNLKAESGLDHTIYGDSGNAYGIAQWHSDRQAEFLLKTGKTIQTATFADQLSFVHYELTQGKEQGAGNKLRAATTAEEAATVVGQYYERPKSTDYSTRIGYANAVLSSAGVTAMSGIKNLYDRIRNGETPSYDDFVKVFTSPATAAGNVVSGALDGVTGAIGGVMNFDLGSFISKQLTGAVWDSVKDKVIPLGVGVIAVLLVALSAWGMVKDTPAGSAVKAGASFVPGGRLFV